MTLSSVLLYLGVLNVIVFGMDKETLSRLNWSHMKVQSLQPKLKLSVLCMSWREKLYFVLISFLLKCAMKVVILTVVVIEFS